MIVSLFVGTGEFVMCSINETCSVDLSVTFSFLEYTVSIPVGYTDRGQLEFVHLIVLGIYTILFTVLQVRLRTKMFQMERVANTNLNVMLVNVSKHATKLEIKELLERYGYGVDNIYLVKKMRPWLRVMNEKCRLKKQYLKACQKKELVEMGTLLNELREIDENLDQYYHLARNDMLYRTSYVIVRLRSEDQRDQLLKKSNIGLATKLAYKLCTCCSPLKLHDQHISAVAAPPPKDLIWQNLESSYCAAWVKSIISYFVAFVLVLVSSFGAVYLSTHQQETFLANIGVSLLIQFTNIVIMEFLEWSASVEDDITHTAAKISLTFKLTFFQFLNITFMPFIIFAYRVFYQESGTVEEKQALTEMTTSVVFIYLGNLLKPLLAVFSIERLMHWWRKRSALKEGKKSQLSQYEANLLFEPVEFHIEGFYSSAVASLMGTFFYLSLVPSVVIVELLLIFFLLVAARHLLFKVCKRPKQFTSLLNRSVNKLSQLCIVIFWAGTIVFRIMLADRQNFPNKMLAMWDNIYFRIEIGVVGAFLLIIYLFSLDEWFGRKLANRQRRNR